MNKLLSSKKTIAVFMVPTLLVFFLIVILPIFFSGYYSLLEWNGYTAPKFNGIQNYFHMFSNPQFTFSKGIVNSLLLAFLSVFVQIPIALLLALVIAKGLKGEGFFRTAYFVPVLISTTVIGQLWLKIYQPNYGMLSYLLDTIGLGNLKQPWLASPKTALACTFFVIVWQYVGYHMLLLYSAIKSIPPTIYDAAKVDGASSGQLARHITIPLIKPMLKVCTTFAIIGSIKTFDLIYILTKGGPIHSTEVPTTIMYRVLITENNYGMGSAMAVFIILECLIITILVQKYFKAEAVTY